MSDEKQHHIDLIEAQILRMSENSKQMKTWCIALVSGVIGIYVQTGNRFVLLIGLGVAVLFAWLDAYYLLIERKFRCVYNDVVGLENKGEEKHEIDLYAMPLDLYKNGFINHVSPVWSFSVWPFYAVALIAVVVLLIFNPIKKEDDAQKIQLTDSSIKIETPSALKVHGIDSVWVNNVDLVKVNIGAKDTLYVKSYNKKVK